MAADVLGPLTKRFIVDGLAAALLAPRSRG
jgi:hypothetical protein